MEKKRDRLSPSITSISLSLSESLCPTTRSKKKCKYKIKEEEHLYYPTLKDRRPSLNPKTACVLDLCRALYRQIRILEDETRPRVEDRRVAPQIATETRHLLCFHSNTRDLGPWFLVRDSCRFYDLLGILSFGYIRPDLRLKCAKV